MILSATVGLIGLKLGGMTIHAAAGLHRGTKTAADFWGPAGMVPEARVRVKAVQAIVIEEFSMMSASLLDLLGQV